MGYFDDYDSEMGWDYRDESLDDDFSVTMDSEEEDDLGSDYDLMSERDETEEDLVSPSEDERFEYMYRRNVIERGASFDDDDSECEMEVESSVAEDDQVNVGFTSISIYGPALVTFIALLLATPIPRAQYEGVSGIIQRFQYLEDQNRSNGSTRFGMSSGMISPPASPSSPHPPPRRSSLTYQSVTVSKSECGRSSSPTSSLGYLPSPSSSVPTSPNLAPAITSPIASSALKGKDGPPRSDSAHTLAEVTERKRNGLGAFASSTASTSRSLIALSSKLSITNATKPKTPKHVPLTGLFAVNKPTGITSTTILDRLQHVCKRNQSHPLVKGVLEVDGSKRAQKRGLVKIGHGGTLDPLARGIVVVGMGTGCKKLHNMSGSSKVYIAEARLGYSSTTLDSTGSLVDQKPTNHITKERLLDALQAFKGEISQTPPLYSALNMDGKRLYDYAREGIPLPREIPSRKVQIHGLDLLSYPDEVTVTDPCLQAFGFQLDTDSSDASVSDSSVVNSYDNATLSGDEDDKNAAGSNDDLKNGIQEEQNTFRPKKFSDPTLTDPNHIPIPPPTIGDKSLYFHIRVHCSSGTYIRTLIADIASHLGTVGLMTDLLRVEQSGYRLGGPATLEMRECEDLERVEDAIQAGNRIWDERTRQHQE
ncbi:hypothetical protein EC957_011564 [Mortierella hygrophila]|uniref:tRNA pseudouridine(55) synthase n=1 Tax=Mortierella hygrophila TaxID=979708 RepID=A0A9P6F974_9FUNG|nr:hypothetical protein EC957_011564 [Mortierella hygrophila]